MKARKSWARVLDQHANCRAALGEHNFLFVFLPPNSTATKQTVEAVSQQRHKVILTQYSPIVCKLGVVRFRICSIVHICLFGTCYQWLVGQRLDVKSNVCPISVKILSNVCPIGCKVRGLSRPCQSPVKPLSTLKLLD